MVWRRRWRKRHDGVEDVTRWCGGEGRFDEVQPRGRWCGGRGGGRSQEEEEEEEEELGVAFDLEKNLSDRPPSWERWTTIKTIKNP